MKITTSILALLVLFLSTQCITIHEREKTAAEEKCCTRNKPCKEEKEPAKDEACNNTCNPFMVCSGCVYILTAKTNFSLEAIKDIPVRTGFKQSFFSSHYNADCWHPPEIV